MADYLQKFRKDTKEFTDAVNYCLNNLRQKNFYLTNIDNENISERSKKVGEKVYDYMVSMLEKMFNNDENKLINNDDCNETSRSYFKIKQEIIKNINSDFNLHQENENISCENNNTLKKNNSLIVIKHASVDKTKAGKLEDRTSSLSYNNSLKQKSANTNPVSSFYKNVNSEEENKSDNDDEDDDEYDEDDEDYNKNRYNKNGRFKKKRKKYMILTYSEKVKLVYLSIDNPTWSLDKLQEVSGCPHIKSKSRFLVLKRQILNDRNKFEKFKTINDWIYQSCVIENPDINEITDAKLKAYAKRVKEIFGPEANKFYITKSWLYHMKKLLGITDESNDVKQEPEKSGSKNVGIYLFKHSSSFEEDEEHNENSDWSYDENIEALEDEEYHYKTFEDDDDSELSSKSGVDSKLSYQNKNADCKNIKREALPISNKDEDNETILKEIIEPSRKKLKTNVSDEEKKRVVDMARRNPEWNFEQLKKESKCQELLFVSQLYDWHLQLKQNRPGSSKNMF